MRPTVSHTRHTGITTVPLPGGVYVVTAFGIDATSREITTCTPDAEVRVHNREEAMRWHWNFHQAAMRAEQSKRGEPLPTLQ
jgi:hypothetical protein